MNEIEQLRSELSKQKQAFAQEIEKIDRKLKKLEEVGKNPLERDSPPTPQLLDSEDCSRNSQFTNGGDNSTKSSLNLIREFIFSPENRAFVIFLAVIFIAIASYVVSNKNIPIGPDVYVEGKSITRYGDVVHFTIKAKQDKGTYEGKWGIVTYDLDCRTGKATQSDLDVYTNPDGRGEKVTTFVYLTHDTEFDLNAYLPKKLCRR